MIALNLLYSRVRTETKTQQQPVLTNANVTQKTTGNTKYTFAEPSSFSTSFAATPATVIAYLSCSSAAALKHVAAAELASRNTLRRQTSAMCDVAVGLLVAACCHSARKPISLTVNSGVNRVPRSPPWTFVRA